MPYIPSASSLVDWLSSSLASGAGVMSMDSVPKDLRGLRACKLCSMVKVSVRVFIGTSV